MFLLNLVCTAAQPHVDPPEAVENALGSRNYVEWGRDGPALLEVGNPQLAPGELPFDVGLFLFG